MNFLCVVGATGGAEVHEIDAGDQEDERGDDGEDVNELDIAVGFELTRLRFGRSIQRIICS